MSWRQVSPPEREISPGAPRAGNMAESLLTYGQFLGDWADADSDVPLLLKAREEHERLKSNQKLVQGKSG